MIPYRSGTLIGIKGISLVELVVGVTIVGILAMVTAPILIDFLESFWLAQNQSAGSQVARDVAFMVSRELREAVAQPDSLRPFVYSGGTALRFYRADIPADSIKYYFGNQGGKTMLFRSVAGAQGEPIPDYAPSQVDFIEGEFSADGGAYGYTSSGRINLSLRIGKLLDFTADTTRVNIKVFCRNFID